LFFETNPQSAVKKSLAPLLFPFHGGKKKTLFLRPPPSSLGGAGGVLHGATATAAMARPLLLPLLLRRPDDSSTTFLIILQIEFVLILFSLVNAAFCQPAQLHQPTRMLLTK